MAGCTGTSPTLWPTAPSPAPITSWSFTWNSLRFFILPWSSNCEPSPNSVATHGRFHQIASIGPVSSNTRASTRLRRRSRIGLTATLRTATATVASSPTPTDATVRASPLSWWACGRCSIRSPTVSMPSVASPFSVLPLASSGAASRLGRGIERTLGVEAPRRA